MSAFQPITGHNYSAASRGFILVTDPLYGRVWARLWTAKDGYAVSILGAEEKLAWVKTKRFSLPGQEELLAAYFRRRKTHPTEVHEPPPPAEQVRIGVRRKMYSNRPEKAPLHVEVTEGDDGPHVRFWVEGFDRGDGDLTTPDLARAAAASLAKGSSR